VRDTEEAIHQANNTRYGLGASLWTQDDHKAREIIPLLEVGNVYINSPVRSHPHMPYGGIKKSGYGREFSEFGLREFVNIKSVVFK
ncbi:MAG: aldehyde dehydrogenase family protein, partial [Candidatus Paceibacteria bacterium]